MSTLTHFKILRLLHIVPNMCLPFSVSHKKLYFHFYVYSVAIADSIFSNRNNINAIAINISLIY